MDTDGLVIRAVVLAAHWQDRAGAMDLALVAKPDCARLALLWADGAYAGMEAWMADRYGWQLAIVSNRRARRGSTSCRGGGWWSARLPGWGAPAG